MAVEIERRFLVRAGWREHILPGGVPPAGMTCERSSQGYLCADPARVVRVRVSTGAAWERAWLTVKGTPPAPEGVETARGFARSEFEYAIPVADARALLRLCVHPPLEKTRYTLVVAGNTWVVDVFHGANAGLVLAEIELEREDAPFAAPPWLGAEVTHDARYCNACLAHQPFTTWPAPD